MSVRLVLTLDRTSFAPGDEVEGTVSVVRGGSSRALEVFLVFRERTRDFDHVALKVGSGVLADGGLEGDRHHRFAVRLPEDALPSFRTENAELFWEVDARSDQLGRDAHARERIDVSSRP